MHSCLFITVIFIYNGMYYRSLSDWGLDRVDDIWQMAFWKAFFKWAVLNFLLNFIEICLWWYNTDNKSTLVHVMAWCHQAPSHYLNRCWPTFPRPPMYYWASRTGEHHRWTLGSRSSLFLKVMFVYRSVLSVAMETKKLTFEPRLHIINIQSLFRISDYQ